MTIILEMVVSAILTNKKELRELTVSSYSQAFPLKTAVLFKWVEMCPRAKNRCSFLLNGCINQN